MDGQQQLDEDGVSDGFVVVATGGAVWIAVGTLSANCAEVSSVVYTEL